MEELNENALQAPLEDIRTVVPVKVKVLQDNGNGKIYEFLRLASTAL
jgi:hypothetical protein